jgi:hypothetical protein
VKRQPKKIYIAGPVSNQTDGNFQAFKEVADQITEAGHIPLYTSLLPKGMSEPDYMKFAHSMLEVCDFVVLLPKWTLSDGAMAEYYWAKKLGKPTLPQIHLSAMLWQVREPLIHKFSRELQERIDEARLNSSPHVEIRIEEGNHA